MRVLIGKQESIGNWEWITVASSTFSGKGTDLWQPPHLKPSIHPFHGRFKWMDGLCNRMSDGMDGNGRSGHPFHCVDEMDGGRGMDRQPVKNREKRSSGLLVSIV